MQDVSIEVPFLPSKVFVRIQADARDMIANKCQASAILPALMCDDHEVFVLYEEKETAC